MWNLRVPSAASTSFNGESFNTCVCFRSPPIAKWIHSMHPNTVHIFCQGKKMLKASQEQGCEPTKEWIKAVRNPLYWCATSTRPGFQELIIAKWQSFMRHVANKHECHPNSLFPKCAHEELQPWKWIKIVNRNSIYRLI